MFKYFSCEIFEIVKPKHFSGTNFPKIFHIPTPGILRTKWTGLKGLQLEVGARMVLTLLVVKYFSCEIFHLWNIYLVKFVYWEILPFGNISFVKYITCEIFPFVKVLTMLTEVSLDDHLITWSAVFDYWPSLLISVFVIWY